MIDRQYTPSCSLEKPRIQAPQQDGRFQIVLVFHSLSKTRRDESSLQAWVFSRVYPSCFPFPDINSLGAK